MIQSLGTLAQSQPLKRRSEGNVMGLLVIFFFICIDESIDYSGGLYSDQRTEDNIWLILYGMGL